MFIVDIQRSSGASSHHLTSSGGHAKLSHRESFSIQDLNNELIPLTDKKPRHSSIVVLNHSALANIMRTTGTGALSANAQQQAKYFFDFQHANAGIRVPAIRKWPGYAFTFHCWIKLRSDVEAAFAKKRRQLYSFYADNGQGFEAFITPDCSSLVVSVCTKREFVSLQLHELDFDSSQAVHTLENTTNTSDYWHAVTIVHVPAKNPFSSSSVNIYVDGVLKKESEFKLPHFYEAFTNIRVGAAGSRPGSSSSTGAAANANTSSTNSNLAKTLSAPLSNFRNVFNLASYGSGGGGGSSSSSGSSGGGGGGAGGSGGSKSSMSSAEKYLNVTSIPSGSQDTVWDAPTCLMGQMSMCFALHSTLSDMQARILYELGPKQYAINWLEIAELSDLKTKFLFHYDAKCCKDMTCYDLSANKLSGKFSGSCFSSYNFKESLNSIGSVHLFYPIFHYLSSNGDYDDLVTHEWTSNAHLEYDDDDSDAEMSSERLIVLSRRKSLLDGMYYI